MKQIWHFIKPSCWVEALCLGAVLFVLVCHSADILNGIFLLMLTIGLYAGVFVRVYQTGEKTLRYGLTRKEYLRNILVVHLDRDPRKMDHLSVDSLEAMLDRRNITY